MSKRRKASKATNDERPTTNAARTAHCRRPWRRGRLLRGPSIIYRLLALFLSLWFLDASPLHAQGARLRGEDLAARIGFDQRLDAQIPLDLVFQDETGQNVYLRNYFDTQPVILTLGYFECPNLCSLVRSGLLDSLQELNFDVGTEFQVLAVSIDPSETSAVAAAVKKQHVWTYDRPAAADGWHFLTGEEKAIAKLADAVGFRYAYDATQDQYAHASGIIVLTPGGRVARYFYGLDYPPRDLRLGLIEAAEHRIGSPVDQLLLFCYHYDPVTGQYSMLVMNVIRLAGFATVLLVGGFVLVMVRQEEKRE